MATTKAAKTNPVNLAVVPITWLTDDLTIGRVESMLGADFVAGFFADPDRKHAIAVAVSRACGAFDACEREYCAAYRSLARLLGRHEGA